MKHRNTLLLLFVALLAFGGCKEEKEKPLIGFSMDRFAINRWKKDRDYMIEAIHEKGGELIMETAQGDTARQRRQVKRLIEQNVDVLVIVPADQKASARLPELAHKADIPVISYDRLIKNSNIDYYIAFDNIKVGELQAEYITKVQPKGNYVIIGGPTYDNNSFLIKLGQMNVLQPFMEKGAINIVYDRYAKEWTPEASYKMMQECIREVREKGISIDAILAANDQLATGVIKALEENEKAGEIPVTGMDADLNAIKNILKGKQSMTAYKPVKTLVHTAAQAAINLAKNGKIEKINETVNNGRKLVESIIVQPQVINQANVRATVINDGYWTKEQVFGKTPSKEVPK